MVLEGVIGDGLRKEAALTRGPTTSAKESGERDNTGARGNGPATGLAQGRAGNRPRALSTSQEAERTTEMRRGKKRMAAGPMGRKPRMKWKMFSFFSFSSFSKEFQIDFEFSFELESNHSIQKLKCNCMSAQTCFYPYI
jgi:hypothetical protein